MNTKVKINWDDINQIDFQYFDAIVREHSTYKEMLYLNEQNYHNIYLRKHFITFEGKKYFIPNPFDFLFFAKDSTIIPDFIKNYKEGKKHFKKNFHKKAPDKIHIERMKKIFNDEFKRKLTSISFIYNDEIGFRNGLLSAYIEFEEVNYDLYTSTPKSTPRPLKEFIIFEKPDELLNEIREHFGSFRGKGLARLIYSMTDLNLLSMHNRDLAELIKSFDDYLGRDETPYEAVRKGYSELRNSDEDYQNIKSQLQDIITKLG